MIIDKRYLVVPVSRYSARKTLMLFSGNEMIMDYKIQFCMNEPEYYFYIDIRYALGMDIEFRTEPDIGYTPVFADKKPVMPDLYKEKFRPAAHFTAAMGWLNDPNGLIYANGKYHMFFQHNPAGPKWSNMHWGHAVSDDLFHWEEKEIAIFPDKLGTAYSGCAVLDKDNLTGLKENENDVILLYYTACNAGMKLSADNKTSQCLAYSTDGGESFKKYDKNPLIPNIINDNRDPKVVYSEEEKCYYMALFLNKSEFALFTSDNLLQWKRIQSFDLPGDGECPDFYPLVSDKGNRYWVFTGAHDKYFIGKIENGVFAPVQKTGALHFGTKSYAAQTFYGLPENKRVRIGWNRSVAPESYFNSSMCTPALMTLIEEDDGQVYLCINPVDEIKSLYKECNSSDLKGKAQDIIITLDMSENADIDFSVEGFDFNVSASDSSIKAQDCCIPLFDRGGKAEIRIITDTTSVEIYSDKGKAFGVFENIADYDLNRITYKIKNGSAEIKITANELLDIRGNF